MTRRTLFVTAMLVLATALGGCAALNSVTVEVATYGDWPAGRPPGRFVIERLPSQQPVGERPAAHRAAIEAAAARALGRAGFAAAAEAAQADIVVMIGVRTSRAEPVPWDDMLWWRRGAGYLYWPRWPAQRSIFDTAPGATGNTRFVHAAALLLRDRASGTPLYEARAQIESGDWSDLASLGAMLEAALKDFPATGSTNPRQVSVALPR